MRSSLLPVALALVVVPGASASGAAKTIGTRGAVVSISADGGRVAVHAAVAGQPDCDSGSVWIPASAQVVRFQDAPCGKRQSDRQYDSLTLAGSRAVWVDYDLGNHAYCNGPYVATLARPSPTTRGVQCPDQPDSEDLFWEFKGDGSLLVARSWVQCEASCPPDYTGTYQDEVELYTVSGAVTRLVAEKRNTALLDVDAGHILLRDAAKRQLVVLDGAGRQVATLPVDTRLARLDGAARLSVPTGTALRTYEISTGRLTETCTMKVGAKLQDVENGRAVYSAGDEVHLLTIATNADRVVAKQRGLVQADLEPSGLFYAYNVPGGGSKPGRVTFVPASALPR